MHQVLYYDSFYWSTYIKPINLKSATYSPKISLCIKIPELLLWVSYCNNIELF